MLLPGLFVLTYCVGPPDPQWFYGEIEALSLLQLFFLAVGRFWPTFLLAGACSVVALKQRQASWLSAPLFLWSYQSASHLLQWFHWPSAFVALLPRDFWIGSFALVMVGAVLTGVAFYGRLEFRRREIAAGLAAQFAIATIWIDQSLVMFVVTPWPSLP